jgi:hypothetical protein
MAVLVNGINYSWCNLNNIAFGVPVTGILAINYDIEQTKENNYGPGIEPGSRGYGNKAYTGSITVYKDWWKSVCDAAPNKDPLAIAPFDWTIAFGNGVSPTTPPVNAFTETLKAFEFLKDSFKANQGDTKLTMDIPFIWAGIVRS